jgi:hypothetical protein
MTQLAPVRPMSAVRAMASRRWAPVRRGFAVLVIVAGAVVFAATAFGPVPAGLGILLLGLLAATLAPTDGAEVRTVALRGRNAALATGALLPLLLLVARPQLLPGAISGVAAVLILVLALALADNAGSARSLVLTKRNVVLALTGLLVFTFAYNEATLAETFAVLLVGLPLALSISRARQARRGGLEYGLLRHPFRPELRPHLLQLGNHCVFWALLAATVLPGTFALVFLSLGAERGPAIVLWLAALALAAFALVPRRRVFVATNALVAVGSLFLAFQLVQIYRPPQDPVILDLPFAGEWYVVAGGRSALLNHHWRYPFERDAIDLFQVVDGRSFHGDSKGLPSYYAFGEPIRAPADGTVTAVLDARPDEPVGGSDLDHPEGNYLVIDIGHERYVMIAHLAQDSVRLAEGDPVRRGQVIARVGDSGNSDQPHIHIAVQNRPTFDHEDEDIQTYPIVFRNTVLTRGGSEQTPTQADARLGDRVRPIGA